MFPIVRYIDTHIIHIFKSAIYCILLRNLSKRQNSRRIIFFKCVWTIFARLKHTLAYILSVYFHINFVR